MAYRYRDARHADVRSRYSGDCASPSKKPMFTLEERVELAQQQPRIWGTWKWSDLVI